MEVVNCSRKWSEVVGLEGGPPMASESERPLYAFCPPRRARPEAIFRGMPPPRRMSRPSPRPVLPPPSARTPASTARLNHSRIRGR